MAIEQRPIFQGDGGIWNMDRLAGFPGDGSAIDAALQSFISGTLPAAGGKLLAKLGTHGFDDDFEIPYHVIANPGTLFRPAEGKTVRFLGVDAGRYRIFDDSDGGVFAFDPDSPTPPCPEWWGADPSGGSDDTAAFQAACDAAAAQGVAINSMIGMLPFVDIGPGQFTVSGITASKPVGIRGAGRLSTNIRSTTDAPILTIAISDTVSTYDSNMSPQLSGFTITGSGSSAAAGVAYTNQVGIRVTTSGGKRAWVRMRDVGVTMCGSHGVSSGTAVSNSFDDCFLINNFGSGLRLEGAHNTNVRLRDCEIRHNWAGFELAGGHLYTIWAENTLIEQNTAGSGDPGSATRPCAGVLFTGSSIRHAWLTGLYFEGHLNDVYGDVPVRNVTFRDCYHDLRTKITDIIAHGTLQRQFGAYYLPNVSNDGVKIENCTINQPRKPDGVSDEDWGTYNVARTTTGSIAASSNALTVASTTGIRVGSLVSIAGVAGYFTVTGVGGTFVPGSTYTVTLDGEADATVSGATVSVHWGQNYAHIPALSGRSHIIRDVYDRDTEFGRVYPVLAEVSPGVCLQESMGGAGSTPEYTLRGPTTMNIEAWNRLRIRTNEFLAEGVRAYIASDDCSVGTDGEYRFIGASTNSTAAGTRTAILAADQVTASGMRNILAASDLSEVEAQNHVTMLSSRRVRSGGGSTVVMGWASEGEASSANRKIELQTSLGNVVITGSLTSSHTFADFAEYFENLTPGVIPLGTLVTLDGDKVRPWTSGDVLIGVVSATPIMVAGDTPFAWAGRYLTGEFGEPLYEVVDGVKVRKENPDWDPAMPQIPRSDRPEEWTCVGLVGQVHARVGEGVTPGATIGGRLLIMAITQEYDAEKGYAVAKCLLR